MNIFLINNSPDNEKINCLFEKYKNDEKVQTLISKNAGFGAGNNLALNLIHSDYHFVINPDIVIKDSNQIDKMINFMELHKEYGMLSPLIKFPDGSLQKLLKHKPTVLDMGLRFLNLPGFEKRREWFVNFPDGYNSVHDAENVSGAFMLFRTNILKSIHGFDENYFLYMEDSDITRKVNEISRTVFFPKAYVYHDWQRENTKSLRGIIHMLSSMTKYFNKWGWKFY